MSGSIEYILFDFDDNRLADRINFVSLMIEIARDDAFRFLKKAIVCEDVPGDLYVPNEPEMLDRAWSNAVRAAPRYGGAYWMEFENVSGLRLSFGFDPRHLKRLNLTVNKSSISKSSDEPNVRELVRIAKLIYMMLRPAYGYGFFNDDVHMPHPPNAEVKAVWDYNFFGHVLVESIGREKLLALPAWRKTEFDDGGVLVEMSPSPAADWKSYTQNYKEAAAVLGLETYYQGG
jgi:hypothetical protein